MYLNYLEVIWTQKLYQYKLRIFLNKIFAYTTVTWPYMHTYYSSHTTWCYLIYSEHMEADELVLIKAVSFTINL